VIFARQQYLVASDFTSTRAGRITMMVSPEDGEMAPGNVKNAARHAARIAGMDMFVIPVTQKSTRG
jgi:hypothetical protein